MGIIRQDYFFNINNFSPPDDQFYHMGPFAGGTSLVGVGAENNTEFQLPLDVTIVACEARIAVNGTLGTTEPIEISAYINNGATEELMISDLTTDARINYASNRALSIGINTSDVVSYKVQCPTWVTNPTNMQGLMFSVYYKTGLDRELSLVTWHFEQAVAGTYNPADSTTYYTQPHRGLVSTALTLPYQVPYNGALVGGVLNSRVQSVGTTEKVRTSFDVNAVATLLDATWDFNSNRSSVILALDSINVPFNALDGLNPSIRMPTWVTNPTGTAQSINLLLERT